MKVAFIAELIYLGCIRFSVIFPNNKLEIELMYKPKAVIVQTSLSI